MKQIISAISLVVPSYDAALEFYVGKLGFDLIEDTPLPDGKRWVLVAPPGSSETRILLAQAADNRQQAVIGSQAGGRVFLFLSTDNFVRDYRRMKETGVPFLEQPRYEAYGTVVVFEDPFGNKWDLIQTASPDARNG